MEGSCVSEFWIVWKIVIYAFDLTQRRAQEKEEQGNLYLIFLFQMSCYIKSKRLHINFVVIAP